MTDSKTDNDNSERISEFKELGVNDVLCEACERLHWTKPSRIQELALPVAFEGKDIVGLAETGSGKTGAFAIPIIQALMKKPQSFFAVVLTPTRELAFQIQEQFIALGTSIGITTACLVGGLNIADQAELLHSKKVHIIIATPGRFIDHVQKTRGFDELQLRNLRYLVIDEADRMLGLDFEVSLDKILRVLPRDRITYMFSATMTDKVGKLQRASLRNPTKISASGNKYQAVSQLSQFYILIPKKYRNAYLYLILRDTIEGCSVTGEKKNDKTADADDSTDKRKRSVIVFTRTRQECLHITMLLKELDISACSLNGNMPQTQRLGALNKFKARIIPVLVATDVASRGLDIPHVDLVVNYDLPDDAKSYLHRVGRTARAGRSGEAISLVTQYSVLQFTEIEEKLSERDGREFKMPLLWPTDSEAAEMKTKMLEIATSVEQAEGRASVRIHDLVGKNNKSGKKKSRKRTFNSIDDDKSNTISLKT